MLTSQIKRLEDHRDQAHGGAACGRAGWLPQRPSAVPQASCSHLLLDLQVARFEFTQETVDLPCSDLGQVRLARAAAAERVGRCGVGRCARRNTRDLDRPARLHGQLLRPSDRPVRHRRDRSHGRQGTAAAHHQGRVFQEGFRRYGFRSQGQCVRFVASARPLPPGQ